MRNCGSSKVRMAKLRVRQRLERLEEELLPPDAGPPVVHEIQFIEADGTVSETMVIAHPSFRSLPKKYLRNRKAKS